MDLSTAADIFWHLLASLLAILLFLGIRHSGRTKTGTPITPVSNSAVQEHSQAEKTKPDVTHRNSTEWYRILFFPASKS